MARDDMPFDDETMTLIMGLGDPSKPGQHGRTKTPAGTDRSAFEFITNIRDMCEEFIRNYDSEDKPEPKEDRKDEEDGF